VTLKDLDFDATGSYYCEVSIDNPIFTKASSEVHLHVIGEWASSLSGLRIKNSFASTVKQNIQPKIYFKKQLFVVGENLIANCTTGRAKPHPHITWLINGKKVCESKSSDQSHRRTHECHESLN
jgi:CD80-like C2-set immunoglobulin domain